MKKSLLAVALTSLLAVNAFAAYTVVLKDGTRYQAKTKWTIVKGRALITLQNGQQLQIDPNLIDAAKSEQVTKDGLGSARVLGVEQRNETQAQQQAPSLGSSVRIRPRAQIDAAQQQTTPLTATVAPVKNELDRRIAEKFERGYENTGIFEHAMTGTNQNIRAELTADTEDRVFNALTATAFLIVRNAGVPGVEIESVDLFMKTTTGGAAGRFRMTRADAEALNTRALTPADYFVRNVIY